MLLCWLHHGDDGGCGSDGGFDYAERERDLNFVAAVFFYLHMSMVQWLAWCLEFSCSCFESRYREVDEGSAMAADWPATATAPSQFRTSRHPRNEISCTCTCAQAFALFCTTHQVATHQGKGPTHSRNAGITCSSTRRCQIHNRNECALLGYWESYSMHRRQIMVFARAPIGRIAVQR